MFIEMEKMNGGTLESFINKYKQDNNTEALPEELASSILRDILSGLCQIHAKDFIHRDLKPENILMNISAEENSDGEEEEKITAKIADFGLSAEFRINITGPGSKNTSEITGTVLYMAPE